MTDKILYNGFVKVREKKHLGKTFEVVDRGDSVNVLLVKMGKKKKDDVFIMGMQYRPGASLVMHTNVAGMIDDYETASEAAVREVLEESGYVITEENLFYIGMSFPSPGACSERSYTYVAVVNDCDKKDPTDIEEGVEFTELSKSRDWGLAGTTSSSMQVNYSLLAYAHFRKYIKRAMKYRGVI